MRRHLNVLGLLAAALLTLLPCLATWGRAEVGLLPPLEIARGLPSHARCVEAAALAERNRVAVCEAATKAGLEAWIVGAGATECSWIWHYAQQAADPALPERRRREALRELIERVGWRAVLVGELPPPYPVP